MSLETDIQEAPSAKESAKMGRKGKRDATKKQIRGSSLLLVGKLLSMGINFAAQVIIVRYLSKTDYGAWAYALSVVSFCQNIAIFGLDRGITRFIPIYHEKNDYNKLFGTLVLVFGSILLACGLVIAAFYAAPEQVARLVNDKDQPIALLFVMILLLPTESMDALLTGLFASFTDRKSVV